MEEANIVWPYPLSLRYLYRIWEVWPSGCLTSSGYLTPSKLCSEPSEEALQRPQWKVMRPTLNFAHRPPPLTKKSPFTFTATESRSDTRQYKRDTDFCTLHYDANVTKMEVFVEFGVKLLPDNNGLQTYITSNDESTYATYSSTNTLAGLSNNDWISSGIFFGLVFVGPNKSFPRGSKPTFML